MCGFVGVFGLNAQKFKNEVDNGTSIIKHRGPDAAGFYGDDFFLTGFNRLKIIDLSNEANQPFGDDEFVLVFNGEIYNYLELQKRFGFETKTSSDTEILFNVLKKFKNNIEEGINLLNGMFAFIFYDKKTGKIILGRDRLGVKPLNYFIKENNIFFASEIKAMKPFCGFFRVNHKTVVNFLVNRTTDYNKETFFDGIYQIKPGFFVEAKINGVKLKIKEKKYWDAAKIKASGKISGTEAIDKFKKLFFDAVSLRFRADVPVSVLLSGGLDSSAIASAAAILNPAKEITAISAVYEGDPMDEKKFAVKVVEKYKNLKPIWVEIKKGEFFESLKKTIYHEEMPLPDGSMVSHFILMEKINKNKIKVVLTGQGGDEILGGYVHTFLPAYEADRIRNFKFQKNSLRGFFHALPYCIKNFFKLLFIFKNDGKFFKDKKNLFLVDKFYKHFFGKTILSSYLINSLKYWSLPGFLHYEDRNSMAFSIEARGPFLDYRLVEFMVSLPNDFKIKDGIGKRILRESMKNVIPEEILKRNDKQGFYAPIEKWDKEIPLDFLDDKDFRKEFNYINFKEIQKSKKMKWRIYTLWLWYNIFKK